MVLVGFLLDGSNNVVDIGFGGVHVRWQCNKIFDLGLGIQQLYKGKTCLQYSRMMLASSCIY